MKETGNCQDASTRKAVFYRVALMVQLLIDAGVDHSTAYNCAGEATKSYYNGNAVRAIERVSRELELMHTGGME